MGEACFMCVKGADGKVELKTLTRLDKPQYDLPVYKGVFTDEEKDKLAETGTLGGIKEMKDTLTGNVCKCYVSFHESTNRIITMPVDAIKSRTTFMGRDWTTSRSRYSLQVAKSPSMTYSARTTPCFPVWPMSIRP